MSDAGTLTGRLRAAAAARLAGLRALGYEELERLETGEVVVEAGRWRRAVVWTQVEPVAPDTLRVAVLQTATVRFWPGYYHAFDGFRIRRDGTRSELTREDAYDLD